MRLIDADTLAKAFRDMAETDDSHERWTWWFEALRSAAEEVDDAPTIDAVERKRGRWQVDPSGYGFWICSACGFVSEASGAELLYNFCPHCGAEMRGENNG